MLAICGVAVSAQTPAPAPVNKFQLTVDSIMRGPALVGYPPSDLRWSGDSKELYFEWRMPGEDEAATWVVGREGGQPRRLSDEERRAAPLANGAWDAARRRILGTDRGDIVVIDTVARKRRDITRTTGNESSPRWARGGTHVTFVRDNNLFIVPVEGASTGTLVQLTDASARRTDPRPTDSQRVVREEEQKLLDWVEQEAERRKRREARDRARALPKFELAERQTIVDAALSADETYAYLVVERSRAGARPRRCRASSANRRTPRRSRRATRSATRRIGAASRS